MDYSFNNKSKNQNQVFLPRKFSHTRICLGILVHNNKQREKRRELATIIPAQLGGVYRSWSGGILRPITFSEEQMITLQSAFVHGSGSSIPDGDRGGEV